MTSGAGAAEGRRPGVLVVCEDHSTRAGVRLALENEVDCYEARSAAEARSIAEQALPSVCLVAAAPHAGLDVVSEVAAAAPYARIVILAADAHEADLLSAVQAGAVGYLPQDLDPDLLRHVVRAVLRGEAAIPRMYVGRLMDELRGRGRRRRLLLSSRQVVDLTVREWEVLEQLRRGATTREIAATLEISEVTVRRHVGSLLRKLDVGNRKEAVALVGDWAFV